jgi:Flp pilus assembly protein TadG
MRAPAAGEPHDRCQALHQRSGVGGEFRRRKPISVARHEHGSVLILVPALVLVLIILGAIAVDSAIAYLGHRELQDFTASLAQQVASATLSQPAFYDNGGAIQIDQSQAAAIIAQAVQAEDGSGGLTHLTVAPASYPNPQTVVIEATATVDNVFAPAVGGHRTVTVTAEASAHIAEVRVGPPGP